MSSGAGIERVIMSPGPAHTSRARLARPVRLSFTFAEVNMEHVGKGAALLHRGKAGALPRVHRGQRPNHSGEQAATALVQLTLHTWRLQLKSALRSDRCNSSPGRLISSLAATTHRAGQWFETDRHSHHVLQIDPDKSLMPIFRERLSA